ncbi:MAG: hypothetical protein ACYS7Y_30290 [Planctomycetota bacterium]|jgi:hypothetical protein
MSNALTTAASLTNLPSTEVVDLSKYKETTFLPRIQLVTKGKYVDKGKIAPGHYGVPISDDEIIDLGATIDVLPIAVRNKALDTTTDPPTAVFNAADEVYEDIVDRAGQKDSGCMFGPSFLFFERNTQKLYEYFCGNKSARMIAGDLGAFLPINEEKAAQYDGIVARGPLPCTLRAKYIEKPRYSWHAPEVGKCSTPIDMQIDGNDLLKETIKFINPPVDGPEIADEDGR